MFLQPFYTISSNYHLLSICYFVFNVRDNIIAIPSVAMNPDEILRFAQDDHYVSTL